MKNRRIEVRMGETVNLDNFESFRLDIGMSADIPDSANLDEEYDKMIDIVEDRLDKGLERGKEADE